MKLNSSHPGKGTGPFPRQNRFWWGLLAAGRTVALHSARTSARSLHWVSPRELGREPDSRCGRLRVPTASGYSCFYRHLGLLRLSLCGLLLIGCVRTYVPDMELGRTGAEQYTVEAAGVGIVAGDSKVAKRLYQTAKAAAGPALAEDVRLAVLAQQVGQELGPSGLLPDRGAIEFWTRHLGLVEPTPLVFLVPQGELLDIEQGLTDGIVSAKELLKPTHIGMVLARAYGRSYWVVVLSERRLEMEPLPRTFELNAEAHLRGALPSGFKKPRVRVRTSREATEDLPVGDGQQFDARLKTDRALVLNIEISGVGEGGSRIFARMPVYVAQKPPVDMRHAPVATGMDVDPASSAIAEAIQAMRRQAGLAELTLDPKLSAAAKRHAEDMGARGAVAHEGKSGSTPPDRVRAAGFDSGLVFENVGRGRDVLLLHDDFMANPGQRSPVLNPEVTHLGIGVARVKNVGGDVYYVTEVFVGEPRAVDPITAPQQVLDHVNSARVGRAEAELAMDEALSSIAQDALDSYLAEPYPTQQVVLDQANAELAGFSMSYKRTAAAMLIVRSPGGVALDPTLEEGATHVGVAVAPIAGRRPDLNGSELAVVLTFGWARTD